MQFQPAPAENVQHAAALIASGWSPEGREAGEVVGRMRCRDDRQDVHAWTWKVSAMLDLPVRGEVLAGNPALRAGSGAPAADAGNGILALVRGDSIAAGSKQLPPASEAESHEPRRSTVIDVPDLGPVRITYQLNTYRHGRSRLWHWVAAHAERAA